MVRANSTDEHRILPTVQTPNGNGLPPLCRNRRRRGGGATPRPYVPGDVERYLLRLAQWVRLADASPRRASLADRVSFRSALVCCPPHGRARCRRAGGRTERCDSG